MFTEWTPAPCSPKLCLYYKKGLIAVGAFLVVMGIINLSTNIKDGGPGVRNAILEIVGGVMVGAADAFVTQITI